MAATADFALRELGLWQRLHCHDPHFRNAGEKNPSWRPVVIATTPNPATQRAPELPQPQIPQRDGLQNCHNPDSRNAGEKGDGVPRRATATRKASS